MSFLAHKTEPASPEKVKAISKIEAYERLWAAGHTCAILLDEAQQDVKQLFDSVAPNSIIIASYGRQCGKSWMALCIADELCRKFPDMVVTYVAQTQGTAKKLARKTMKLILKSCPPHLQPVWKTQESCYRYPNGSEIEFVGNNAGRIENARGPFAHLIIADEIGFWTDSDYAINSVLFPKLNSTGGKMLIISTPPKSASHPFYKRLKKARANGTLIKKTILDCPRYTEEQVDKFAEEVGGYDSNTFRREYMVEEIADTDYAVFPEATEAHLATITGNWKRPPYFDAYVSCDWGTVDKTAILFGYWDFRIAKLVIEDEFICSGTETRSDRIAEAIYAKEAQLWQTDPREPFTPYNRISDTNLILLNDLNDKHDLAIMPTAKDNKEASINAVRLMLANSEIIINPKCTQLLFDLENATWNKSRTDFERSKEHGHNDAGTALIYLVRNLHRQRNPYPPGFDLNITSDSFVSPKYKPEQSDIKEGFKKMFSPKRR